jgi:multidrug transporter EmrE-like cation transporter
MYWTFLLAAIAASVVGQALLKTGAGAGSFAAQLRNWSTLVGLGVYGVSAILYIVALRRIPLSVALPCNALSYILVALIGHYGFQEALGTQRLIALAIISGGVALLAAS